MHSALDGGLKRSEHSGAGIGRQPQVVDRDVERLGGAVQERRDALRDRVRGLAAVSEKEEVEGGRDRGDGGYRALAL
jgi:hypothetical protein